MGKFLKFIKDNYNSISVIVFFLITALLILYLLPREGKFRYEFQRGRPWLHETLIAPFDFPIYKPESELRAERDSVLADFRPYFRYDNLLYDSVIARYHESLDQQWESAGRDRPDDFDSEGLRRLYDRFYNFSTDLYRHVYQQGIIAPGETADRVVAEEKSIVILRNNIGVRTPPENYFREKTAYEYIRSGVDKWVAETVARNPHFRDFLQTIEFSDFLIPNLYYDQATTERVRQSLLNEISLARGMVQSGERIVSQGDLITNHTYLILESLKREYETRLLGTNLNLVLLGQFILVFALIAILYLFLYHFRREILTSARKTLFILFFLFLMVSTSIILIRFSMINFYVVPFAIVPIIIRTFYDERLALFIHTVILLLVAFFAPNSFEFLFLNYVIGLVAIFSLSNLYLRSKLFYTAVIIVFSYSLLYFGIAVTQERSVANINWMNFAWFGANGLLVLTTYPLLYIFEKTFGFISDGTLVELSDTNQPLLRKLAEEAPGTFQHSIQVANLAEAAVREIGGNPLLVRAGALYHDIGKMSNPAFFIENQTSGYNPHDSLDFEESAQVIISHVSKGVEIARKHNLPEQIIDFIQTHHGTTRVQYFYKSFLKKYPNEDVDARKYTYPGPKPFSRETAVLMMADSVEAASRSLKEISTGSINELVESIIDNQFSEDQFSNTNLTFRDIATVKSVYKNKLMNIYHARISYPK
jgi:cyclic-di-AMP phosphodiesterase PgpH